jgi:hypothetical protein
MSNHKRLLFFNKEGDNLNFNYNEINNRFEGDILFHENSTDVYKTVGIYTMEKIPEFSYENPGEMFLDKFQLFNEFGFDFFGSNYKEQVIKKIEPINNDPDFHSKWIYGDNFESKFPIGSIIKFNNTLLEFTNILQTYTVVSNKENAIMIISSVDNATFELNFQSQYLNDNIYTNKTISGINAIGIYDYIDTNYSNNLSIWSEPNFYDKLYKNRKLNVINSYKNNGTFTISEEELTDNKYYKYYLNKSDINNTLIMEVILKTDLPKIYDNGLNLETSNNINRIIFNNDIPLILKPGTEFKISGSLNNQNFLTVASLPDFSNTNSLVHYNIGDQVLWNNKIYECILSYTHSHQDDSTMHITPNNIIYWTPNITHIDVNESLVTENILSAQIYLTTNKLYYTYDYTIDSEITLASAAEKYKDDFDFFDVELFYENNILKCDLRYPSDYIEINYYNGSLSNKVGTKNQIYERLIEVKEILENELNYDHSIRDKVNIVFTDIDEYGIKITINEQTYEEEIAWVISGSAPDMERTIDRTLRNWLSRNYMDLQRLGINASLSYIGSYISPFYNAIKFINDYPNVEMFINDIKVGSTAEYYVEHSTILFHDMGKYLSITINTEPYDIDVTFDTNNNPVISETLENWITEHKDYLRNFGILVSNINNLLVINTLYPSRKLEYTINTGKINIPGVNDFKINQKLVGNLGTLITSNEIKLTSNGSNSNSFIHSNFSTGMALSINNTFHTWVNTEFNIQYLDNDILNLSYEGPFWGFNDKCDTSPFITLAFDLGFGQTACGGATGGTGSTLTGEFNNNEFDHSFNIEIYNPNTYTLNDYNISSFNGTENLVDLIYIQLNNSIYALGDSLIQVDSVLGLPLIDIELTGNTQSQFLRFNERNNYLYCVSKDTIYVIDPLFNNIVLTLDYTNIDDVRMNNSNGDIFITYDTDKLIILDYNHNIKNNYSGSDFYSTYISKMIFNDFESYMYISTSDNVYRINNNGDIILSPYIIIPDTVGDLFYEPIEESVYVYDNTGHLYKIDNSHSNIHPANIINNGFNNIIFNNLTGYINISSDNNNFLGTNNSIVYDNFIGKYGFIVLNQYDGDIYLSSNSKSIDVINPVTGMVIHNISLPENTGKIIYNPDRRSVWTIQPDNKLLVEVEVHLHVDITPVDKEVNRVGENSYGTLNENYDKPKDLWLKTREYLRKPRENYIGESKVNYYWKWYSDNTPEMFMYDFSGEQLLDNGSYSYTGIKPLQPAVLSKYPNKELDKINLPQYQQTIFDKINFNLSYINDIDDISNNPEALELFLGFKSEEEGALRSILQLYKKEDVSMSIDSTSINDTNLLFETLDPQGDKRGSITINETSNYHFLQKGFKPGQIIGVYIKDVTNDKNQYISNNNGFVAIIREVYFKTLILDFISDDDYIFYENTVIIDYPKDGENTYLKVDISVLDKEIGRFGVYGQTEIEDIRFKIELSNVGKLIAPNEVFIFKEYDILEGGIDWTYLNKKRKEMLLTKHLIYPYIGSYKSIINAINFFGYNDLKLSEYYKNTNSGSEKFGKLFKMEIPDIFDNSVNGWTESEFVKNNFPNDDYTETNLFNLSYDITNKDGDTIIDYSIDEIIIKLQGLKYWLKRNIIPLTHKILDITGNVYFKHSTSILHMIYDTEIINIRQNMTPISFKLNEAYLMPVNSGSTVYNCVLDFYSIIPGIGSDKNPTGLIEPPKPYNNSNLVIPEYFDISIRTYKTYKEWYPFTVYKIGDKIRYYDKIYESVFDNNKINNPREYENVKEWLSNSNYESTSIVKYNNDIFVYSGNNQSIDPPSIDPNWRKVTRWKEIDYEPVQTIKEFREINLRENNPILPFNFTIDTNIDPFIVIEVTSDNGYGLIYRDRKNYELRSQKDLTQNRTYIDLIGPFKPINII